MACRPVHTGEAHAGQVVLAAICVCTSIAPAYLRELFLLSVLRQFALTILRNSLPRLPAATYPPTLQKPLELTALPCLSTWLGRVTRADKALLLRAWHDPAHGSRI